MSSAELARLRLSAQHIAQADFTTAEDVVAWMGAMQAQDYGGALWSVALRTKNLTQEDIEQAIVDRKIIRTWPMRGTLHFVAAKDARWMISLLAPRVTAATTTRRESLEIDDDVINKARQIITGALSGGTCLSRQAICSLLDENGIATAGQRGIHLLRYFSELGLLCFGPHADKQPTFVLMDEWLPPTGEMTEDEALGELAYRFFTSHGPATIPDFAGWGYMTLTNARRGLESVKRDLISIETGGKEYWMSPKVTPAPDSTFLLPGFDEYMLGYKNRFAALAPEFSSRIVPGNNGMFLPTLIIDGQVKGTWKRTAKTTLQTVTVTPFELLSNSQIDSITPALSRYESYSNLPTELRIAG